MSGIIVEEMSQFNASIAVTELLMKTLENCAKELASRCISEAASRHGFDASEEIRVLGLENLSLIRKQMAKKSSKQQGESKKKSNANQERGAKKEKKSVFPMPFVAELVNESGCKGLAYNRGLFTQCQKNCMENGNFCKSCQAEADKNASGCPDCGTVEARLATGLYEFKDSKGRSPISYVKVLEKLKLSQEAALEAAGKLNIEISNEHFVIVEKSKKSKGRPKKTGAIKADNVSDMFAKLASDEAVVEEKEISDSEEDKPVKVSKKAKLSEEEKAAKKAALEEQRALKKAERDAKLAEERAEKEAKRKAEADQKKAEREEKIAKEKAEREAKRAQEKAEKEAKKAAEKAAKEATKGSKKPVESKTAKEEPKAPAPTPAPAPEKVSVTRIQIGGKTYLKSSTNILYDLATKDEVGLWDPETKTIKELPEDDEEEEEEGYESD